MGDEFFSTVEEKLASSTGAASGFLVGGKATLADCAMSNWYHSFYDIANLNIQNRYPNVYRFYKKQDQLALPDGAVDHQKGFTMFGKAVHAVNACTGDRACCCKGAGHNIN